MVLALAFQPSVRCFRFLDLFCALYMGLWPDPIKGNYRSYRRDGQLAEKVDENDSFVERCNGVLLGLRRPSTRVATGGAGEMRRGTGELGPVFLV
jgi:hypothetical protein